MWINERYAGAISSKDLKSDERTTFSDSDVLAAMGLAGKSAPLGVALARLLAGDGRAAADVVTVLGVGLVGHAFRNRPRREISPEVARQIATFVLDWFRDSACRVCGGVGFKRIEGTPSLSDNPCPVCRGSGKRNFDGMFDAHDRELARWAAAEIEREQAIAGPIAMRLIAQRMF